MVLYLIGLGLYGEKDITVRGLEIVKSSDYVYMEYYTSILGIGVEKLSAFYWTTQFLPNFILKYYLNIITV